MSKTCVAPLELDRLIAAKLKTLGYEVDDITVAQWRGGYNESLSEKNKSKFIDATNKDKYIVKKTDPATGVEEEEVSEDVIQALLRYNNALKAEQAQRQMTSATIDANNILKLRESYKGQDSATIIRNRTSYIRMTLEKVIDNVIEVYKKAGYDFTRELILLGVRAKNGQLFLRTGFPELMKQCYTEISNRVYNDKILGYNEFIGDTEIAKELLKILQLDHWSAFVSLVREGLKKDYPDVNLSRVEGLTEDDDWAEYDSEINIEEMPRDGITKKSETSDFFKTASKKTRAILRWLNVSHKNPKLYSDPKSLLDFWVVGDNLSNNSDDIDRLLTITKATLSNTLVSPLTILSSISEFSQVATDDLGEATIFEDEQKTHSYLSNGIFMRLRNKEDMFNRLRKYCLKYVEGCIEVRDLYRRGKNKLAEDLKEAVKMYDPTIFMLYLKLLELESTDPDYVTAFVNDFTKSTNRYVKTSLPNAIKGFVGKLITLNERTKNNNAAYALNAMMGRYADSNTIYDENGNINQRFIGRFKLDFLRVFGGEDPDIDSFRLYELVKAVAKILKAFGFLLGKTKNNYTFLNTMAQSSLVDFRRVVNELKDLASYGFKDIDLNKVKTFEDVLKAKNGADESTIKEALDKIQKIMDKYMATEGSVLPAAKVKDSQGKNQLYSTLILPSYLSEMYATIQQFIEDDADGDVTAKDRFKNFLVQEYLCSRFFYYDPNYIKDGKINPAISDLVKLGRYQYNRDYILNRTIRDWWDACNSSLSLSSTIGTQQDNVFRELLIGDNAFENAFTKEQALSMITHFGNNNDFVFKKEFISEQQFLYKLNSKGENRLYAKKLYIIEGTNYQMIPASRKTGLMEITTNLDNISPIEIQGGEMEEDFKKSLELGYMYKGGKNTSFKPNTYYSYNGKTYLFITGWLLVPRTKYQAPVFILGDSNISKYTIETAYSKEEILSEMMNVSMQEIQRDKNIEALMLLDDEDLKPYVDTGIIPRTYLNTYKKDELRDKWFILPMLNGVVDKEASPSEKEEAIRQALEKGFLAYKENLRKAGILSSNDRGIFEYLEDFIKKAPKEMSKEEALDKFLELQYYNHVFHMIEQLLLLTFDPAMYTNTTDLQKRFKEVHASGSKLDLLAVWKGENGVREKVFVNGENTTQSCLYFKDISKNSELTNPDLMFAMAYQYCVDKEKFNEEEVRKHIANHAKYSKGSKEYKESEEYLKNLMGRNYSKYEKYRKNTLTDGQGYRMLDSYRAIKIGLSLWSKTDEKAYRYILYLQSQGYTCLEDIIEKEPDALDRLVLYMTRFQPLKPFTFTHERIFLTKDIDNPSMANSAHMAVQHKYAEVVLIPCLLPRNSELRNMALMCKELKVDMICSDKCVKVGGSNIINLNDEILSNDELQQGKEPRRGVLDTFMKRPDEWRAISGKMQNLVHKLLLRDFRIQNNITEHNEESLFGTQVRKLALGGIKIYDEYGLYSTKDYSGYVDGKPMVTGYGSGINLGYTTVDKLRGKELMELYNGLVMANMLDAMAVVKNTLGKIDKTSEMLISNALHNDRSAMDALNFYMLTKDDAAINQFVVPLFDQILEHDTTALLLSTFKKKVNKQKINGGSAVQASALFTHKQDSSDLQFVTSKDKKNIIYAETEVPWNFVFVNRKKNRNQSDFLDFNKYCNPDGTLKLSDEETEDELFQSYKGENGKTYIPLIEKDYPGILDILAYRIPTERDYSMMRLRIVRFSQPVEGGIIKVPVEGTTRSGFDFDIDKLYMMKYQYTVEEGKFSKQERKDIWDAFFSTERGKTIKEAINDYRRSGKKNEEKIKYAQDHQKGLISDKEYKELVEKLEKEDISFEDAWNAVTEKLHINLSIKDAFEEGRRKVGYEVREEITSKYDVSKSPLENSVAARNNMLVSIIMARQEDPDTFDMRQTPGGFVNLSRSASFMRVLKSGDKEVKEALEGKGEKTLDQLIKENERPEYDYSDPWTMIIYNQLNQIALKLVGIFANQNSNVRLCSLMKRLELVKPIAFCDKSLRDLLHYDGKDGVDPELTIAELLAASVDAVKDPILNDLNINTLTANTACLLGRIGYSTDEIALLFNLPIIRAVCDYMFDNNITDISQGMYAFWKRLKNSNKNMLGNYNSVYDLQFKQNEYGISEEAQLVMTRDNLVNNIVRGASSVEGKASDWRKDEQFIVELFGILHEFVRMSRAANSLNSLVASSKFTSSNGVGSTIGDLYELQMRTERFNNDFQIDDNGELSNGTFIVETLPDSKKAIIDTSKELSLIDITTKEGKEHYFNEIVSTPFAYEQCMYDMNRQLLNLLNSSYYPYGTEIYSKVRLALLSFSKYGLVNARVVNSALCDLESYILALQEGSVFDENTTVDEEIISGCVPYLTNAEKEDWGLYSDDRNLYPTNREFFLKYFPKVLSRIINQLDHLEPNSLTGGIPDNPFLLKGQNGVVVNDFIFDDSFGELRNLVSDFFNFYEADNEDYKLLFNLSLGKVNFRGNSSNLLDSVIECCAPWLKRALFLYNFYKDGYEFGVNSYINRITLSMLNEVNIEITENEETKKLGYSEFLRRLLSKNNGVGEINVIDFIMQEILNHPDFDAFTYTPKAELLDDYRLLAILDGLWVNEFEISIAKENNDLPYSELLTSRVKDYDTVKFNCVIPCINIDGCLYIVQKREDGGNPTEPDILGKVRYKLVGQLGKTAKTQRWIKSGAVWELEGPTENLKKQMLPDEDTQFIYSDDYTQNINVLENMVQLKGYTVSEGSIEAIVLELAQDYEAKGGNVVSLVYEDGEIKVRNVCKS